MAYANEPFSFAPGIWISTSLYNQFHGFVPSPSFINASPFGKKALRAKTNNAFLPNTVKNLASHPLTCCISITYIIVAMVIVASPDV